MECKQNISWSYTDARSLYDLPFNDLLFRAQCVHRENFDPNHIQMSELLNIKTGGCPEDCGYCSQSVHNGSRLKATRLMKADEVIANAKQAQARGATRFCMGAAWRSLQPRDEMAIVEMIKEVKALGLETCMTLGKLSSEQALSLSQAGLDYYNHNIDTSECFYPQVTTTHTFRDRLDTLDHVRRAGMKVCCGGILGLGETVKDRIDMLLTLANLPVPPESVPINMLMPMPDSRMADVPPVDSIAFVRVVALARLMMPSSYVRLTAGRANMSNETQTLCFLAGANSIFIGDTLLTASNPDKNSDNDLMHRLGMTHDQKQTSISKV
ncbi:biotin synthase BioB [Komagataeibacter sp. FXV3]|uniref:biotin synthase BioB n=1 Tax=Komagataeibacter sp. FXV3 TaxID=2608998 RepID=UPI001D10AD9C|nr:biotin synthase BioB [Komagataeibacter sp. FXV3]